MSVQCKPIPTIPLQEPADYSVYPCDDIDAEQSCTIESWSRASIIGSTSVPAAVHPSPSGHAVGIESFVSLREHENILLVVERHNRDSIALIAQGKFDNAFVNLRSALALLKQAILKCSMFLSSDSLLNRTDTARAFNRVESTTASTSSHVDSIPSCPPFMLVDTIPIRKSSVLRHEWQICPCEIYNERMNFFGCCQCSMPSENPIATSEAQNMPLWMNLCMNATAVLWYNMGILYLHRSLENVALSCFS
jgi:hypothetical protein